MSVEMKTLTIGSTTYEIVDEKARNSITSINYPTWSDLQIEMPMGTAELLNAVRIQNAANNATLLSTEGNLAHNAMAEMCGGIVFVTWTENTAGTTVDYANGSGNCSVFGRMLRYKFGISQNTPVWSDMTDTMDLFPIGSTVYGADGSELGTIIDVSDSTIYSPDKGIMYVSAMAYCSDINGQRPVTRTITFDSSLKTSNITNDVLVFGAITAWTLTIDGVSGDYDFSRINSSYKKRPQINSKPIPNNLYNRTSGFLIPVVIDNVGVAVLESTDAVAWNLLCILPDADAHLEASMFLAAANRWFVAIRCKKNNIPSMHIIKVNTDTYTVLDGWYTKLRGTDSRPSFLNNFTSPRFVNYPILFLSDYNREGGRIVIIEDSDPQHVRTIATLRDNLSNYTQVLNPYNSANWDTTMKQIVLLIGTNGDISEKRGVSVTQVFLDHTQYNDLFDMVNLLSSGTYELPIASETTLGGVKPSAKTDSMTKPVGVDENGGLFVEPSNGAAEIIDATLTQSGKAADAAVVGQRLSALSEEIAAIPSGADGKSAYQYAQDGGYTGTESEFAAKLAAEKFANPNALTFTGAVTGSYDGSAPLSVEIPSGGGGTPSGNEWVHFLGMTVEEDITTLLITDDDNGNTFSFDEIHVFCCFNGSSQNTAESFVEFKAVLNDNITASTNIQYARRKTGSVNSTIFVETGTLPQGNTVVRVQTSSGTGTIAGNNQQVTGEKKLTGLRFWASNNEYIGAGTEISAYGRNRR